MRQKAWEEKYRLGSFRKKAKVPPRSASEDNLSIRGGDDDDQPGQATLQLAIESPPQLLSPSYSRRQSLTGVTMRRPSIVASGPGGRPLRDRRRRSVSPMDPRDALFRRRSPSRYEDDHEPLIGGGYGYDERVQSPTVFGVDNDLLDIAPVSMSRRQSFDRMRSPRMSLATSPREHTSFFAESDPMPYLRHLSHQYSQERRLSQTFPEGRPLTLPPDRLPDVDRERDADSVTSDDRIPETRF
ncbi:hypothetical protein DPMN_126229 [Dreissena polymorpha]|uniref:Uncharacterized protein n=2 Tax=Dreissena polymorpha TaxID=45954 RepID=A0A9D4GWP8_DREPO|nr:hypothetical protein DPMN_126229 [Dreissena polymorpha]